MAHKRAEIALQRSKHRGKCSQAHCSAGLRMVQQIEIPTTEAMRTNGSSDSKRHSSSSNASSGPLNGRNHSADLQKQKQQSQQHNQQQQQQQQQPQQQQRRTKEPSLRTRIKQMFQTAQRHVKAGRAKQSIALLREILQLDPKDSHSWLLLGRTVARGGDTAQARQIFSQAAAGKSTKQTTALPCVSPAKHPLLSKAGSIVMPTSLVQQMQRKFTRSSCHNAHAMLCSCHESRKPSPQAVRQLDLVLVPHALLVLSCLCSVPKISAHPASVGSARVKVWA